jgi:hypothetical protein
VTYPGYGGQVGPPPSSTVGWQVRQSTAGSYPGSASFTTVVDAMGTHAPASAVTAAAGTVAEEVQDNPHPIEAENIELDFDQATLTTDDIGTAADYTGKGGA